MSLTLKVCILQENGFEELTLVLFGSVFLGLHILFYNFFFFVKTFSDAWWTCDGTPQKSTELLAWKDIIPLFLRKRWF